MGIEWAAMIIPILGIIFLITVMREKVVWWELWVVLLPSCIVIPTFKGCVEHTLVSDTERHGGIVIKAAHYEKWNEYIHKTCTRSTKVGKVTVTTNYDCSYIETHPEYFEVQDSIGEIYRVSKADFQMLSEKFGNKVWHDMHRRYHTIDGDKWITTWNGDLKMLQPSTTEHQYVNRVQTSKAVMGYRTLDHDETKGLYQYPPVTDKLRDSAILGQAPESGEADRRLMFWNAVLGEKKKVRMWLLLFNTPDRSTGLLQEAYWCGGNKNEVVVCIGVKQRWAHVFCWSPDGNASNSAMAIDIRDFIEEQDDLQLVKTVDFIADQVDRRFTRKSFKEFDYLTIELPMWAHIINVVLNVLVTVAVCAWAVLNDIDPPKLRSLVERIETIRVGF